jgi:hypothetical protein
MINNASNIHPYKVDLLDKATCYNFLLDNGQTAGWSWTKRRLQDTVAKFIKGREHEIQFTEFKF